MDRAYSPSTLLVVGADDHVVLLGNDAKPDELANLGDFLGLSEAAPKIILEGFLFPDVSLSF
jgi:hypothetical protein